MSILDWGVLLILGISLILSLMRGFVQELFSLAAWIVAFLVAKWGAALVGPWLPVDTPQVRYFAGFVVVFLAMMVLVLIGGRLLKSAVGALGLGGADKLVGALFGLARGLVIITGLTLVAGLTALPKTEFWLQSRSAGLLERMATTVMPLLPHAVTQHIQYR